MNEEEKNNLESNVATNVESNTETINTQIMNSAVNEVNSNTIQSPSGIDNTYVEPQVQTSNETMPPLEEKKKSKAIIIIPIVLIILALVGYGAYKFMSISPYESGVESVFSSLKSANKINVDKPFRVSGKISLQAKDQSMAVLNDYSIDYAISSDTKNNLSLLNFNLNEKDKQLIDLLAYMADNKVYLQSKKLTDKTIYTDVKEVTQGNDISISNISQNDVTYLINKLEEAFKKALSEEKYVKGNKDLTINGSTVKANSFTYTINKDNYKRVVNNFVSVLEDNDTVKTLSKVSGQSEDKIKEALKQVKEENNFEGNLQLVLYTKGLLNKSVGFSLLADNKEVVNYLTSDNYAITNVILDDTQSAKFEAKGNVVDIKFVQNSAELLSGKLTTVNDKEFNLVLDVASQVTINLSAKLEDNVTIDKIDTGSAVSVDNLTEEDSNKIMQNLSEALQGTALSQLLGGFSSDEAITN